MVVGSKWVASTTTVATTMAATPNPANTAAREELRPEWVRRARPRSSSSPLTATTTKLTRRVPPTLASARAAGTACSATPRSAHGNPPNGKRPRSASNTTHTAAVRNGDASPRRAYAATSAPTPAIAAAIAATSGTMATYPK